MIRCANCRTIWLGDATDEAIVEDFLGHPCQQTASPGAPHHRLAAPLPTTHGSVSVERGMIASRASVIGDDTYDPFPAKKMRHPSARLAAIVPMFNGAS